jgi:Uma2 family endonuclease
VTAALEEFYTPPEGWTTDDLDALPEDGIRRELIDGVLLVSPSPTDVHQIIAGRLMVALEESCPPRYQVTQAVEIRVDKQHSYIPDVLVATAEAAARQGNFYHPDEVVLAVEIVSRSSKMMDRKAKPALYAAAGIPFFWRVEPAHGIAVHAFRLGSPEKPYEKLAEFTTMIDVDEPWEIKIPVTRLVPRFMAGSVDRDPDRRGEDDLG